MESHDGVVSDSMDELEITEMVDNSDAYLSETRDHEIAVRDEAIGDSESGSTTSLEPEVTHYDTEYGRRYHNFKSGKYHRPSDEREYDRLDIMHIIFEKANEGRLHEAPIPSNARILDLGTGTGLWPIEIGEMYPTAEIIGVDLDPCQATWVPTNVHFQVYDIEDDWNFKRRFHLIHSKYNVGIFRNPQKLFAQCYDYIEPGGYIEFKDIDITPHSQTNSLTSEHSIKYWCKKLCEASSMNGTSMHFGKELFSWISEAGFTDVQAKHLKVPVGRWAKMVHFKDIGAMMHHQLDQGLEGMSSKLFQENLEWSHSRMATLLAGVRKELSDGNMQLYFVISIVWARKP